jgi:hypothetical protein
MVAKFTHPFHVMILPHPFFCHLLKTRNPIIFKQDSEISLPLNVGRRSALFYASDFGALARDHQRLELQVSFVLLILLRLSSRITCAVPKTHPYHSHTEVTMKFNSVRRPRGQESSTRLIQRKLSSVCVKQSKTGKAFEPVILRVTAQKF